MNSIMHVSVCVCTYKRPQSLSRLLTALDAQATDGRFTYSIVIADRDVHYVCRSVAITSGLFSRGGT